MSKSSMSTVYGLLLDSPIKDLSSSSLSNLLKFRPLTGSSLNQLKSNLTPNTVLVKIRSAGINPSDTKNIQGAFHHTRWPRIIGRDFSGEVIAAGDKETENKWLNKPVYGSSGLLGFVQHGTHQEYLQLKTDELALKPSNLTFEQAASIGTPFVTAYSSLAYHANVNESDVVLTNGASGSVGSSVVQLCKSVFKTKCIIGIDRKRAHNKEKASESTSTKEITLYTEDYKNGIADIPAVIQGLDIFASQPNDDECHLINTLNTHTDPVYFAPIGKGPTVIMDVVGQDQPKNLISCAAYNCRYVSIATTPNKLIEFDLFQLYRRQIRLVGNNSILLNTAECARILNLLTPYFESNALLPPGPIIKHDVFDPSTKEPYSNIYEAYESVIKGVRGKVVLNFNRSETQ